MSIKPMNVGFLGAGYISKWHGEALSRVSGATLTSVCDLSKGAASALASSFGAQKSYTSIDEFLGDDALDVVHILTPPHVHFETTKKVLEAGKHAFVEKPLVLSSDEAIALQEISKKNNAKLGINHNFLMLPGYDRLKRDIVCGTIGPIDSFSAHWRFPLAPLRSGPYGLWMLREPANILFELGSHLFAFAADLFDELEIKNVELRYPVNIPGDITHYQGWRITGQAGETAVTLDLSLIEGHDDRSIEVRGVGALARFNFAEDSYVVEKATMQEIVLGPLVSQTGKGFQHLKNGVVNAARQTASLNMLAPYGLSITRACQSFYQSLRLGGEIDPRLSVKLATRAIQSIESVVEVSTPKFAQKRQALRPVADPVTPTMLVIGGTGFIGRKLTHALADQGFGVRVLSRSRGGGFDREDGRVSVFTGSLTSEADLLSAMEGIDGVFHLARSEESSWEGYLQNDVAVTRQIGEACLKAGVKRLVYTGTIDSYDASQPDRSINENTPFDHDLTERNLYARSKAECEKVLLEMAQLQKLPLVIARPGIVIGEHGPLQHWGIAMWRGATACKMWGDGKNILPFVSVEDTADGLVKTMTVDNIEGRSFNLIGDPLLTGLDYFGEIEKTYGVKMRAKPTPIWTFYLIDLAKYWAKRLLAKKSGLKKPTQRDWKSRAQLSPYQNSSAKSVLGWQPISDRATFVREAIAKANLFGVVPFKNEFAEDGGLTSSSEQKDGSDNNRPHGEKSAETL